MKKTISFLLAIWIFSLPVCADSYCVMIDDDNTIVEEKNMHEQQSVASISKIMTAVIALEQGSLQDTWTIGKEINGVYGSAIYLKEGQDVTLEDLVYGLMLRSGNDAAVEIATHLANDEKTFVDWMNKKAQELGMNDTIFHNASGLDEEDDGNLSSAYDMALLMSYAMKNEDFRRITGSEYYTSTFHYRWKNKNRLLFDYEFTNGGKTGFTKKAGRTLVTSASYNGLESVVVTLRTDDDFAFHKEKHTTVFQEYEVIEVLPAGTFQVAGKKITVDQPVRISVKKSEQEQLEIKSHFESKKLIVEVMNQDQVQVFEYSLSSKSGGLRS